MKRQKHYLKLTEIILISFVWLVLLAAPVLFNEEESMSWQRIIKPLDIFLPLFIIFLLNRFFLVPQFLFKGKRLLYVGSIVGVIALFTLSSFLYYTPPLPKREMDPRNRPEFRMPPPKIQNFDRPLPPEPPMQTRQMPPFVNLLIFSLLMVGFDTGLKSSFRFAETENEKAKLEKEHVVSQLDLLRTQLSPHFFMNTLNNIHTLIDTSTDHAKEAVLMLSKMMRYLLYETAHGSTSLKKEVEFIESYINLMKLRVSEKVIIGWSLPSVIPDKTIPPLLFTSFIENAFKHGISYQQKSFIQIDLLLNNERLLFQIKNSKAPKKQTDEGSGIGIENAKKRLDLLYDKNYHLDIIDSDDIFTINLSIPL